MSRNNGNSKRRRFSAAHKAAVLRQHLVDKKAISDLCDEHGIQPSVFYSWQKALFDGMEAVLDAKGSPKATARETELARQNEALKAKLAKKDSVIAQISEEFVTLKKELGEP